MPHQHKLLVVLLLVCGFAVLAAIGVQAVFYGVMALVWLVVLWLLWRSGASSRYGRAAAWAFEQGDYERSVAAYTSLMEAMPGSPEAHLGRGAAYFHAGDVRHAIDDWSEAARLRPNYAEAHANLGNARLWEGDFEEAAKSLSEALRLDPRLSLAHYNLACARLFTGEFSAAANHFRSYLAGNRQHFEELFLAGCHDDANDPRWTAYVRESIRLATLAIEKDARDENAHVARAIGRLHFREYSEALADCEAALNLTPDDCLPLYLRGFAHKELGHEAEAAADLVRARNLACPPAKADVK